MVAPFFLPTPPQFPYIKIENKKTSGPKKKCLFQRPICSFLQCLDLFVHLEVHELSHVPLAFDTHFHLCYQNLKLG
ncbi:hypothetical protein JHK85_038905 [Glycine max]|uniref:Uncharacterized protein n=1 Tax=Glycine max TaxID=3847 RepID=K7M3M6_SOYBN|nr:hypothetical protein JHK85_038905 [Glycine max]KAH1104951.1 hypothetical protein GYH30_038317 [Glycine max]